MVVPEELADEEEYEDILEDIRDKHPNYYHSNKTGAYIMQNNRDEDPAQLEKKSGFDLKSKWSKKYIYILGR